MSLPSIFNTHGEWNLGAWRCTGSSCVLLWQCTCWGRVSCTTPSFQPIKINVKQDRGFVLLKLLKSNCCFPLKKKKVVEIALLYNLAVVWWWTAPLVEIRISSIITANSWKCFGQGGVGSSVFLPGFYCWHTLTAACMWPFLLSLRSFQCPSQ